MARRTVTLKGDLAGAFLRSANDESIDELDDYRKMATFIHMELKFATSLDGVAEKLRTFCRGRAADVAAALVPLARIADAYDANELDDEARKTWGMNDEHSNTRPPEQIELYCGRGGKKLLTLADCLKARAALK